MKSLNNLKAKLKKQGGFTLIEMLIVVAIIGILVAISIPAVNASLEKAKEATDKANQRAAFGLGMVNYLSEGSLILGATPAATEAEYVISADGQGELKESGGTHGQSKDNKSLVIKVKVNTTTGQVTAAWE